MRKITDVSEHIANRISPEPNSGCWLWMGAVNRKGYGLYASGKMAHRVSYEAHVKRIPDGLQIDHLCRVRCCVNPQHLEPVTLQENIARGESGQFNSRKTHCPKGHEYSPENTGVLDGERYCRTCRNVSRKQARKDAGCFLRGTVIVCREVSRSLKQWSRITGLSHSTISRRIARGLSPEEAMDL